MSNSECRMEVHVMSLFHSTFFIRQFAIRHSLFDIAPASPPHNPKLVCLSDGSGEKKSSKFEEPTRRVSGFFHFEL